MITTTCGRINGIETESTVQYLGIPYAKPPVGALRWLAPVPMDPWDGVWQADHFRCRAMQPENREKGFYDREFRDDPAYMTPVSEDCLYLNIWVPRHSEGKKLPVAFWIHGGAFIGGSGHEKEFDGEAYCRRGIILVTVNYRLGIWGFLAHPLLSAENERQVSGNYGILDQIAALKWVYENIASFGGDPDSITVFGQSAGAMSTQTLISSPLTGIMIKRAVMQSGGGYHNGLNRDDITLRIQEDYGLEFSRVAGVRTVGEMRALPAEKVLSLTDPFMRAVFSRSHGLFLVPCIDGYVLPEGYDAALEGGRVRDIPYLVGSNEDDLLSTPEQKAAGLLPPLQKGCEDFAAMRERHHGQPVYVYYFTRDLPGDEAGAFHSSELWYTFGTLSRAWRPFTPADEALSGRMLDHWCAFIRSGDPNGEGLPPWPPFSAEAPFVRRFDL